MAWTGRPPSDLERWRDLIMNERSDFERPEVKEFAAKCRKLLEMDGTVRRDMTNKKMVFLHVPPFNILSGGEELEELMVFCPGPPGDEGNGVPIYSEKIMEENGEQEVCMTPVVLQCLELLRRRLVLDTLAEIPDD